MVTILDYCICTSEMKNVILLIIVTVTKGERMNLISKTPKVELLLKRRQILRLGKAQQKMAIECKKGDLWITNSSDHGDHVLSAGQRYTPVKNSKLVIEAINDACMDIEEQ
jgi:hypothetical protein